VVREDQTEVLVVVHQHFVLLTVDLETLLQQLHLKVIMVLQLLMEVLVEVVLVLLVTFHQEVLVDQVVLV
tara:strand:+ start:143 stop:352 length:210 start_codon:yes stop_codon:yes gene_type:complete